jgi:endonuclease-3 related protein
MCFQNNRKGKETTFPVFLWGVGNKEMRISETSDGTAGYLWMIYRRLNDHFGNLNWWPGDTPFEIIVGAILTQNTNWKNVESALENLKDHGLFEPHALLREDVETIAGLIRPSGYYNIKTQRLRAFLQFLNDEYHSNVQAMFDRDIWALRSQLLNIRGIGEETADSILLYAGGMSIFVVDAYTKRILQRAGMITESWGYRDIQKLFMDHLPHDVGLFNQYHALLVNTGKYYCRKRPLCEQCPLYDVEQGGLCMGSRDQMINENKSGGRDQQNTIGN